jgi:RHS repeat-associated protein
VLNAQGAPTVYNLTYAYDYVGDATSFVNGVGVTFGFTPNRAQRLTTVTSSYTQDGPGTLLSLGHYNAFGSMVSSTLGNGVTESYGYTSRGWLNALQAESPGIVEKQATPGTGTVTVNGSEKSVTTGTPGKGSVTISGTEETYTYNPCKPPLQPCPITVYDSGTVKITVNGFVASAGYMGCPSPCQSSTSATVASDLVTALNVSSSPVTATLNGSVVNMTAKTIGSSTNYSLSSSSTSNNPTDFPTPSFKGTPSGSTLTGGTGPTTVYDTGTVTVTVNGTVKASPSYGSGSTGSTLASALASALNGSLVTATASGNVVTITSVATGQDTNYSLAVSSASNDPSQFNPPSFTMGESGSTLTGGANEQTSNGPAYTLAVGYAGDGDVTSASDSANGNWSYAYDAMNRLTKAAIGSAALNYVYDRFGNRWQQNATGNGSWPQPQYSFDANNHIVGGSYDAAGNLLNDGTHSYTYDAENRISTVDGGNTATYTYDAEGRRASKNTFTYLYDLAGHQVAELNSGSWDRGEVYAGGRHLATYSGGTTYFPHVDWLGTERVRTNTAGNIVETCISLPFGDGQSCTGSDSSPMHFTGKERDSESGLDFFGARYYASSMGRWMVPDWAAKPTAVPYAMFGNPQSLNLYSYVGNNPLLHFDPDGLSTLP